VTSTQVKWSFVHYWGLDEEFFSWWLQHKWNDHSFITSALRQKSSAGDFNASGLQVSRFYTWRQGSSARDFNVSEELCLPMVLRGQERLWVRGFGGHLPTCSVRRWRCSLARDISIRCELSFQDQTRNSSSSLLTQNVRLIAHTNIKDLCKQLIVPLIRE